VTRLAANGWWYLDWNEVKGGVVAGLLGAFIAWGIGRLIREKRNRDDFGRLAGDYDVMDKADRTQVIATATIKGRGPRLEMTWQWNDGSLVTGQVSMNEQSRVTGAGSYTHVRGSALGWGSIYVQVADHDRRVLLVDGTFTDSDSRQQVASAWVWRRRERG
jgi:hypothetical protein